GIAAPCSGSVSRTITDLCGRCHPRPCRLVSGRRGRRGHQGSIRRHRCIPSSSWCTARIPRLRRRGAWLASSGDKRSVHSERRIFPRTARPVQL
ncbi:uncharacterized protein METZ01_LOCUS489765, partial [marine metagenome]